MKEQEMEATATTYTALVSAYCKSDDLDAALEVWFMLCSGMMQCCTLSTYRKGIFCNLAPCRLCL
jgi:pentatricopeptide repeat protein